MSRHLLKEQSVSHLFSPRLDSRRIASALAGQGIGSEVRVHEDLASTNDLARELGTAGYSHGLVILTESQSAGRGRRENIWHAPSGRDLLMTVLLRPEAKLELWPRLTTVAALAICKTVEATTTLKPMIKWPNDVYVNDRKISGILAETFTAPAGAFMALGIGLNVNTDSFPPELRSSATSLLLEEQRPLDRNPIVIALLKQLEHLTQKIDIGFDAIIREVRERSWLLGKRVTANTNQETVEGLAVDVDGEGRLIVRKDDDTLLMLNSAEQVRLVG